MTALAATLAAAYALRGVAAVYVPASGSGPIACRVIPGPMDEVASFLVAGARFAGYRFRAHQGELALRPRDGDLVTFDGLTLRVKLVKTSPLDDEWYVWGTPVVAPSASAPSSALGHHMPPLAVGWAWA